MQISDLRLPPARALLAASWLAVLVGLVFAGPILWLTREWLDNPYYEHGLFVPLVSAVLVVLALPRLVRRVPVSVGWVGPALVVAGLALRVVGALAGSEFLAALALVLVLLGLAGWWLGPPGLRLLAFPIGYLLVAIPLPFMDDLGFYFQRLSTVATASLVALVGVPATYQGAEVSLPAASFIVGVQCSGLYSTVTLASLGLLFMRVLGLPSVGRNLLLLGAIVPVALTANVFRLGSLLCIAHWQDADAAMRYYHDLGGVVFWLLALGLLFAVGKALERPWSPVAS